jgi:hypothetical protein
MGSTAAKKGIRDGKLTSDDAQRIMSGPYDMKTINISAGADEIDLQTAITAGAIGVGIIAGADGNIIIKTVNDVSGGYVTIPVTSGEKVWPLPDFRYIQKADSIASATILFQLINQG